MRRSNIKWNQVKYNNFTARTNFTAGINFTAGFNFTASSYLTPGNNFGPYSKKCERTIGFDAEYNVSICTYDKTEKYKWENIINDSSFYC